MKNLNRNLRFLSSRLIRTAMSEEVKICVAGYEFFNPNFDREWEEAKRYPEFLNLGKEGWIKLVKEGRPSQLTTGSGINNTDAGLPESFKLLEEDKKRRALKQLHSNKFEMPIVAIFPDGKKELIAGNTRLALMLEKLGKGVVWSFEVPKFMKKVTMSPSLSKNLHFLASKLAETPRNERKGVMLEIANKAADWIRKKIEGESMVVGFEDIPNGVIVKFNPLWFSDKGFQAEIEPSTKEWVRRFKADFELKTGPNQIQIVFDEETTPTAKIEESITKIRKHFPNVKITKVVGPSLIGDTSFQIRIQDDNKAMGFMSLLKYSEHNPIWALIERSKNMGLMGGALRDFDIGYGKGTFALRFADFELVETLEREANEESDDLANILRNDFGLDIRPGNNPGEVVFNGVRTDIYVDPDSVRFVETESIGAHYIYKGDLGSFLNSSTRLKKLEALWPKITPFTEGETMELFEDPEQDDFADLGVNLKEMMESLGYASEDGDSDLDEIEFTQGNTRIWIDNLSFGAGSGKASIGGRIPSDKRQAAIILKEVHNLLKI